MIDTMSPPNFMLQAGCNSCKQANDGLVSPEASRLKSNDCPSRLAKVNTGPALTFSVNDGQELCDAILVLPSRCCPDDIYRSIHKLQVNYAFREHWVRAILRFR